MFWFPHYFSFLFIFFDGRKKVAKKYKILVNERRCKVEQKGMKNAIFPLPLLFIALNLLLYTYF